MKVFCFFALLLFAVSGCSWLEDREMRLSGNTPFTAGTDRFLLKSNTMVSVSWDNRLLRGTLASETGVHTAFGETLRLAAGSTVGFYNSGALKWCYPVSNTAITVGGKRIEFLCDAGGRGIGFFENGSVSAGYLGVNAELDVSGEKTVLPAGTRVFFEPGGGVYGVELADRKEVEVNGNKILLPAAMVVHYGSYRRSAVSSIGIFTTGKLMFSRMDLETKQTRLVWVRLAGPKLTDVGAFMFMENTAVRTNGAALFCRANEWYTVK